ncbi:MAG: LuxR family transcriptional regulator [Betaproteobacteria bacterium]|nr:LuxR family transcriptional regulator [Betaproteobacteria bacterium]
MVQLETLESLQAGRSVEELHATVRRITKDLGFDHFLYGVQVNLSLARPYQFILSGYPDDWRTRYDASRYVEIDPTVRHCATRCVPIVWSPLAFSTPPAERLMHEAREHGLASGASFAIHGRRGEMAMLSLASSSGPKAGNSDILHVLGAAQLLACYLHEAVQRVVLSKDALPIAQARLTRREKECLLWASEGKTAWEIGKIVRVSERTVVFHLQNAARKMGVATRQHAVARALSMNLIAP